MQAADEGLGLRLAVDAAGEVAAAVLTGGVRSVISATATSLTTSTLETTAALGAAADRTLLLPLLAMESTTSFIDTTVGEDIVEVDCTTGMMDRVEGEGWVADVADAAVGGVMGGVVAVGWLLVLMLREDLTAVSGCLTGETRTSRMLE